MAVKKRSIWDPGILVPAIGDAVQKLNPSLMMKNPVMFVTMIGALVTTAAIFFRGKDEPAGFVIQISLWLWFTVLFANFAEAVAEGRGKAQAKALRKSKKQATAHLQRDGKVQDVPAETLRKGDTVLVSAGEMIPADGEIVQGAATVDESAITGE